MSVIHTLVSTKCAYELCFLFTKLVLFRVLAIYVAHGLFENYISGPCVSIMKLMDIPIQYVSVLRHDGEDFSSRLGAKWNDWIASRRVDGICRLMHDCDDSS